MKGDVITFKCVWKYNVEQSHSRFVFSFGMVTVGWKKRESNPFCSLYLILFQLLDCVSFWQRVCSGLEPISGGLNLLTWLLAHVCLCNSHHSKPIVLQDEQLFFSFFEPMRTYWVGSIPRFFLQVTLQYHLSIFLCVYVFNQAIFGLY